MTPAEQCREKILELQSALVSAHSQMPVLLRLIHQQLKQDPEIVTILTEQEISVIVSGLKKQTNTEISAAVMKSGKRKVITEDDI